MRTLAILEPQVLFMGWGWCYATCCEELTSTPADSFVAPGTWRAYKAEIALYVADLQSDWPLRIRLTVGCEVPIWTAI
jgi:hypothetical protein